MVIRPPPNCTHLDNWRRCRLDSHKNWLGRLLDLRPRCILDRIDRPRDGEWTCPDQDPYPRPPLPTIGSGAMKLQSNRRAEK
jgi:hypothetical protein